MLVMVVTYALTVRLLRSKAESAQRDLMRRLGGGRGCNMTTPERNLLMEPLSAFRVFPLHKLQKQHKQRSLTAPDSKNPGSTPSGHRDQATQTPTSIAQDRDNMRTCSNGLSPGWSVSAPAPIRSMTMSATAVVSEQKATKVLGVVFFSFVFCWAPFFLLNMFFAACPSCQVPDHVVSICLWLGYVSSTINPVIYTVFNKTFRAAFVRLLKCQCHRSGRTARYHSAHQRRGGPQSQLHITSNMALTHTHAPTTP